jgi:hypothetical protein
MDLTCLCYSASLNRYCPIHGATSRCKSDTCHANNNGECMNVARCDTGTYRLFSHLIDEHGLTLVGSELDEICRIVGSSKWPDGTPVISCPECEKKDRVDQQLLVTIKDLKEERSEYAKRIAELEDTLRKILASAKEGRDWNFGHFCVSRNKCQGIADIAAKVLLHPGEQLNRGEFICRKCGLRKDGEHEHGDF